MKRLSLSALALALVSTTLVSAADGDPLTAEAVRAEGDILWTCIAAFLVFFMQAGFAFVEGGFTRAKNLSNILMKNVMDFSIGSLIFWAIGFGLMFGVGNSIIGQDSFFYDPSGAEGATDAAKNFNWAFLLFQTVFAATAATIISGAMAERTKFIGYLVYSVLVTAVVYPVFGHWAWGSLLNTSGWLENLQVPFHDFAGSTVVHSVGAWAALAGAIVIGPRIGKFTKEGKALPIPGHNMAMGALGVFILWLGWFGFNPGSTTAIGDGSLAPIAVMTNLSAAAGAVGAMIASWVMFKKPDISMTLNGALAGLVAITAGCDVIGAPFAALTGFVAGILVVGSVLFFEKIKVDDPVGAVSVHGVCGAWGTIAVGLFGGANLVSQLIGVAVAFAWAFPVSLGIFYLIKITVGLRVSAEDEMQGLDISEHGAPAYHGFAMEPGLETVPESATKGAGVQAFSGSTAPNPAN